MISNAVERPAAPASFGRQTVGWANGPNRGEAMRNNQRKSSTVANHSSGKLLTILEFLADQAEPIRLLDISKTLNINASTLLRFLTTLVDYGYVRQDEETSKYSLTYKICALGNKVSSHINLAEQAKPYMRRLVEAYGEMSSLGIEQNHQVVYVATMQGQYETLQVMHRIGSIAPMYCTGIGKLILLNYSEEEVREYASSIELQRFTENTITTVDGLLEELEDIRKNGFARDREECEIGASCVAFPVYNAAGEIVAGISISGPTTRMKTAFGTKKKALEALAIVDGLSAELGYIPRI